MVVLFCWSTHHIAACVILAHYNLHAPCIIKPTCNPETLHFPDQGQRDVRQQVS